MSRPKETHEAVINNVSYTTSEVRIWGFVTEKNRDVLIRLTQESAEALIADITKAFAGMEAYKAKLAEAKYNEYLALRAQFEERAQAELAATNPVVTE